jgi:hypothetical protein
MGAGKRREITESKTELKEVLDETLIQKLDRLKKLWSHKYPSMSDAELISSMAELCLEKLDPLRRQSGHRKLKRAEKESYGTTTSGEKGKGLEKEALAITEVRAVTPEPTTPLTPAPELNAKAASPAFATQSVLTPLTAVTPTSPLSVTEHTFSSLRTRYINKQLRIKTWQRDQGRCQYQDRLTGRRCGAEYKIQIDHIQPLALGGTSEQENLRLLCAAHNQKRAEDAFGRWGDS